MAEEPVKALDSYRGDYTLWRQALGVAQQMNLRDSELLELAGMISETLMERHEYAAAATVLLEYMSDVLSGIRALLKGAFWEEAVRVAYKHGRGDLVPTEIKSSVFSEYKTVSEDLKEMVITFQKQRARLETVRKEFVERQAKIESGEYDPLLDTIDMMSDTTSMASSRKTGFSARTGRSTVLSGYTAKSRRRADRKRAAGREGGFYEEEFLVNSLYKAVEKSNSLRAPIHRLITALMRHLMIKESRDLQNTYAVVVASMKAGAEGAFEAENIVNRGTGGKTVEEEKIAYMVSIGSLPSSMFPGGPGDSAAGGRISLSNADTEVEKKRDPKYPTGPPIFSNDVYGLDVL
ncbi:hypothetical protein HK100_001598 [Physocladia obscura]|uniref:Uncharacterized protein n=1 Tax=Physocladia obscura TaxID=109957 RepID=A0AAD5TA73_9FUNG|nr:hypothetical protein HK100_001598 [Physocladia obscura]